MLPIAAQFDGGNPSLFTITMIYFTVAGGSLGSNSGQLSGAIMLLYATGTII